MGGRGASSGISAKGKPYGTEYKTLLSVSNLKFVEYNDSGSAKAPQETKTQGRVYVTVNKDQELKHITYFDKNNKRYKTIDLTKAHKINGVMVVPHTHKGYEHDEKGSFYLSPKEQKMVDRVRRIWDNHTSKQ